MSLPRRTLRVLVPGLCGVIFWGMALDPYEGSIRQWRREREEGLKAKDGWLTVAGLFWLKAGENRAGSDPSFEIVLPEGRAPGRLGVFDFQNGKTQFRMATGAHVTVNGKPVMTAKLKPDTSGSPDLLQSGDFTLFVIERGGRFGIRMRDLHSEMRERFHGLRWYPVNPAYRVSADFIAHATPQTIAVPNVLGQTEQQPSPGYAEFRLSGKKLRLHPVVEDGQLFFIFRDVTAGKTTYGGGRFLYAAPPKHGKVELDFNKAYNPPCAFTPYATCPLPPRPNRIAAPIEAGEMKYADH